MFIGCQRRALASERRRTLMKRSAGVCTSSRFAESSVDMVVRRRVASAAPATGRTYRRTVQLVLAPAAAAAAAAASNL